MREERCVVCPSFGVHGKREVHVEGDMVDEGVYAAIVEVHGMYVGDGDTANAVYDDIVLVLVASVGADGEVAGPVDAVVGRAGVVWVGGRGARLGIVASVAATSSW